VEPYFFNSPKREVTSSPKYLYVIVNFWDLILGSKDDYAPINVLERDQMLKIPTLRLPEPPPPLLGLDINRCVTELLLDLDNGHFPFNQISGNFHGGMVQTFPVWKMTSCTALFTWNFSMTLCGSCDFL